MKITPKSNFKLKLKEEVKPLKGSLSLMINEDSLLHLSFEFEKETEHLKEIKSHALGGNLVERPDLKLLVDEKEFSLMAIGATEDKENIVTFCLIKD